MYTKKILSLVMVGNMAFSSTAAMAWDGAAGAESPGHVALVTAADAPPVGTRVSGRNVKAQSGGRKDMKSDASTPISHPAPQVEPYLLEGRLADGEAALGDTLKKHPHDDQARFGLGMLQFLRAVENLSQDLHHFGLREMPVHGHGIPFLRLPVPTNPNPQQLTYRDARRIAQTFIDNVARSEKTLAAVTDPEVKLPLHFGAIKLDLNGDGKIEDGETLWKVYSSLQIRKKVRPETAKEFVICFDRGDIDWLRGYCHLLSAVLEVYLAHDTREMFECTAHIFFKNVDSPYKFLSKGKRVFLLEEDVDIADLVALIHLIRWQVVEPNRMTSALHHLEKSVAQSKLSWKFILAETDDDHEWIPNPNQTGVIPQAPVTIEMITAWQEVLDEAQRILSGEVLIPFWRGEPGSGINVRKVFLEPRTLDLVLWVQGPAAMPFVETGRLTKGDFWRRLEPIFNNNLIGYAFWFN
jgi:hypothetical protein